LRHNDEDELDAADGRSPASGTVRAIARSVGMLCLVILLAACFSCRNVPREGEAAPLFELNGLDGRTLSLQELEGKVVVLHFWATWCPPCLDELPRLFRFFRNEDPNKFVLVPVSVDNSDPDHVRRFLVSWGIETKTYVDPGGELARRYGTIRFPETYVVDPKGIIRKKVIGAGDWDSFYWERFLQGLYDEETKRSPLSVER
jgi:thiol-disulfide isomerase/thioredoxin